MPFFVCPRCQNSNPRFVGYLNDEPYCRRCISFSGVEAPLIERKPSPAPIELPYKLSDEQRAISNQVRRNYKEGIDTLIYAVCGAGKTELVYGVIADALRRGEQVGFALPRRDVVIELFYRLKEGFPENKVIAVYGGHNQTLTGDIIVLTTHQIYRYPNYFDLLVMDEIDAFPFRGNDVLNAFYKHAVRGHVVLMSATPSKELLRSFQEKGKDIVELRTRFHKHPIPVPKMCVCPLPVALIRLVFLLRRYKKTKKQCFIFAPTISKCESLYRLLAPLVADGTFVHSKDKKRSDKIAAFKKGEYRYLVTTSVLERGITVRDLQVIVFEADKEDIYDSSTLIQIAGRAGRKYDAPTGEVTFFGNEETRSITRAIKEIEFCNTFL